MIPDPSLAANPSIRSVPELRADTALAPDAAALASAWQAFRAGRGERWSVWLDTRSGAPTLVQGEGIPWIQGSGNHLEGDAAPTIDSLATSLRAFARDNASLLLADETELVLDRRASASITPELWLIVFTRRVSGVPVTGDGYVFFIGHGNLIAFGSPRWSSVAASPDPVLDRTAAFDRLRAYLGLEPSEPLMVSDAGGLAYTPILATRTGGADFSGPVGTGYRAVLTWRFAFHVGDGAESWVGLVDAHTGRIVAFGDDTQYAQVKGGVFPGSNNGVCPGGCEQPGFPMPFPELVVDGAAAQGNALGRFICSGGTAATALTGPYVRVTDACGVISQSVACDNDLDLGTGPNTDCAVPEGSSPGNTHAARTSFYHLNRAMEHARGWLPANPFLNGQIISNTNVVSTCSANSLPSARTVVFYRDGSSTCRNSGEIAGVIDHEWGHLLSYGDGSTGLSNPEEAYGDITAFMLTRSSCIGQGFFKSQPCGGYGNPCLAGCTGVRDVDWASHVSPVPTTVTSLPTWCTPGTAPCGRQVHCEAALVSETLWDLVNRDLPASGVDASTAWVMGDRLWFLSRQGTSGAAYSCGSPASTRSCSATHWMQQLRVVDDDDGNLANGTPHAAAIFAAFNRHEIPCGSAGDPANQSTTICPALAAPALSAAPGLDMAVLSWSPVAGAASYHILRNDLGCAATHTLAATTMSTSFADTELVTGRPEYYVVQAVGLNGACAGPLSSCVAVTPALSSADLAVAVTDAPDPVPTGQTLTYDVTVTNLGPGLATRLILDQAVSEEAPFLSLTSPPGWACPTPPPGATANVSCSAVYLAAGASASFVLAVKPRYCLGNGALVYGLAAIDGTSSDPVGGNSSGSAVTLIADSGSCEDGDACTSGDACSVGACVPGPPVPLPAEVGDSVRLSGGSLSWTEAPGAFSLYRGSRANGSPWAYNQTCLASPVTSPAAVPGSPPVDQLQFFLVSRRDACGESVLGRDSGGTPTPNASPCP